jgi:hypothetical protein
MRRQRHVKVAALSTRLGVHGSDCCGGEIAHASAGAELWIYHERTAEISMKGSLNLLCTCPLSKHGLRIGGMLLIALSTAFSSLSHVVAQTQSVQRAVMFEEDGLQGKSYEGPVRWHIKMAADQDVGMQRLIEAQVDVPDPGLAFTLRMGLNNDQSLSASHTIVVTFAPKAGAQHQGILELAGIVSKSQLAGHGAPLSGVVSKIANSSFQFALSDVQWKRERNLQLLKEDSWLDVLIRYNDQVRAVIALEKGSHVSEALATWR